MKKPKKSNPVDLKKLTEQKTDCTTKKKVIKPKQTLLQLIFKIMFAPIRITLDNVESILDANFTSIFHILFEGAKLTAFDIDSIEKTREAYINRISKLGTQMEKIKMRFRWILFFSILFFIGGVILLTVTVIKYFSNMTHFNFFGDFFISSCIFFFISIILFVYYSFDYSRIKFVFLDLIENLKDELELLEVDELDNVKRAEKLFNINQKELKRYYDLNIKHLKSVFPLGIVIIFVGIGIIIGTLLFFKNADSKTLELAIGCISGMLVNFIGAMFIKIYVETVNSSTKFHEKLIYTNSMLFSNVLIAKVKDDSARDVAFTEIAKIITQHKFE
ncbi:TRADD-N-associated membrane domain-containing protein [Anaerosporobacter sp.]|uniref:TRADD-N-associated membrane domain-containing protein n=1 Tax=Anaerosporobacter sp. TaxID=1872529 RepID=UPI00286F5C45|nr:hypothetical protein [Anaerosporobacter sp.]